MMRSLVFSSLILALMLASTGCSILQGSVDATPAAPGTLLYADDFSNPASGWGVQSDDGVSNAVTYDLGGLRFNLRQPDRLQWSLSGREYTSSQVEVDAVLLSGSMDDGFGVLCRFQDRENFYAFLIGHDGYYGLVKLKEGNAELVDMENGMKFSPNIRTGGIVNHLRVDCTGSMLTLHVNGNVLMQVEDADFTTGQVGLVAVTHAAEGSDILFDTLAILQP